MIMAEPASAVHHSTDDCLRANAACAGSISPCWCVPGMTCNGPSIAPQASRCRRTATSDCSTCSGGCTNTMASFGRTVPGIALPTKCLAPGPSHRARMRRPVCTLANSRYPHQFTRPTQPVPRKVFRQKQAAAVPSSCFRLNIGNGWRLAHIRLVTGTEVRQH